MKKVGPISTVLLLADKLQKEADEKETAAKGTTTEEGKKVRLLSEEDTPKRRAKLMRLLGSLRFLGIRELEEPKDQGDLKPGEEPTKEPLPPKEEPKPEETKTGEPPKPPTPEEE